MACTGWSGCLAVRAGRTGFVQLHACWGTLGESIVVIRRNPGRCLSIVVLERGGGGYRDYLGLDLPFAVPISARWFCQRGLGCRADTFGGRLRSGTLAGPAASRES